MLIMYVSGGFMIISWFIKDNLKLLMLISCWKKKFYVGDNVLLFKFNIKLFDGKYKIK